MKANVFGAIIASTLLGWVGVAFAQTPYGSGESARCNTMTGEQKDQCLRDEANKAQGTPKDPASAGATREGAPGERYGRSPHCDTMTGDDKTKCLVEEARKDANPATLQTPD